MILCDVNILVYAFRKDLPQHENYRSWLEREVGSPRSFAMSDLVISGFMRVVTHAGAFKQPSRLEHAIAFAEALLKRANCVRVAPGPRHWSIFTDLCRKTRASGNAIPDAYLAALAIESGSELISADRSFASYPGLQWRNPVADGS